MLTIEVIGHVILGYVFFFFFSKGGTLVSGRLLWNNDYVVHYFDHSQRDRKALHRKVIPMQRLHGERHLRPKPSLLKWHHRQCVQMHVRGFSYGVALLTPCVSPVLK